MKVCICPVAWIDELGVHPRIQVGCPRHWPLPEPKPLLKVQVKNWTLTLEKT